MLISEIIELAQRSSDILFTREFYKEDGKFPKEDVFRVNIKGRVNKAFEEYNPYESVTFHTDHLIAKDWICIKKEQAQ
jgi:hypothetical protein